MELTPNIKYNISLSARGVSLKSKNDILSTNQFINTISVNNWRLYSDKIFYGNLALRIEKLYNKILSGDINYDDFELSFITNLYEYPEVIKPLPQDYRDKDTILDPHLLYDWYSLAYPIAKDYDINNNKKFIGNLPLFIQLDEDNDNIIKLYQIYGNYLDDIRVKILFQNYFNTKNTYDEELNDIIIINNIIKSKGINIKNIINESNYDKLFGNFKYDRDQVTSYYDINYSDSSGSFAPIWAVENNIYDFINEHPDNESILPYNLNKFGYEYKRVRNLRGSILPFKSYPINNIEINIKKRLQGDINELMKSKGLYSGFKTISNIMGLSNYSIFSYKNTVSDVINHDNTNKLYTKFSRNPEIDWKGHQGPLDIDLVTFNLIIDSSLHNSGNITGAPLNLGGVDLLFNNKKYINFELLSAYNSKTEYSTGMKYMKDNQYFIIDSSLNPIPYFRSEISLKRKDCINKILKFVIFPDHSIIIKDGITYTTENITPIITKDPFKYIKINEGMIPYIGINDINIYYDNLDDKLTIPLGIDGLKDSYVVENEDSYVYNVHKFKDLNITISNIIPNYSLKKYSPDNIIDGVEAGRIDIGHNIGRELDKYLYNKIFREEYLESKQIPKGSLYLDDTLTNELRLQILMEYGKQGNINDLIRENNFTNIDFLYNITRPLSSTIIVGTIIESNSLTENINGKNSDGVINRLLDEHILRKNYIFNEDETINETTLNIYDKDDEDQELILN